MTDRAYFNITAGSPAAKPINDWLDSIHAHQDWVRGFAKRHGLDESHQIVMNKTYVIGFAPKMPKDIMLSHEHAAVWHEWLVKHPLWRRVKPSRGTEYAVPLKTTVEAKALAKEWAGRPKVIDSEGITGTITGLHAFKDLMEGMTLYSAGWRTREDGSILFVIPHFATKSKNWKPLKGLKRGNQDKLRDEWEAKE